jgi:hypothetical protein
MYASGVLPVSLVYLQPRTNVTQSSSFLMPLAEVLTKLLGWLDSVRALLPPDPQASPNSVWTGGLGTLAVRLCCSSSAPLIPARALLWLLC